MKAKSIKYITIMFILTVIALLYFSFLYMDYNNVTLFISSDTAKYMTILLCFTIALLTEKDALNSRDRSLLQVGLFMTTLSDLCLLIIDKFTIGVAIFCIVQITYTIRYRASSVRPIIARFIIILEIIVFSYIIAGFFIKDLDILYPIALFYAFCLITSVSSAIKACKNKTYPSPNRYMIALGMILFLLCDINVGLYNVIESIGPVVPYFKMLDASSLFLMWFFYLPSQVLLSLSGYRYH